MNTMLYKFKSKATGDVIMLEANGRQLLGLIGKGDAQQLVKGILEPMDMPAAQEALTRAVAQDDAARKAAVEQARAEGSAPALGDGVSLRQRTAPFLAMLQRCLAQDTPIVWGV